MNFKQHLVLMGFLLVSVQALTQTKMTKSDSIYLKEKVVMESFISKGTLSYKMPASPEGYKVQLIGSDNLSVIS